MASTPTELMPKRQKSRVAASSRRSRGEATVSSGSPRLRSVSAGIDRFIFHPYRRAGLPASQKTDWSVWPERRRRARKLRTPERNLTPFWARARHWVGRAAATSLVSPKLFAPRKTWHALCKKQNVLFLRGFDHPIRERNKCLKPQRKMTPLDACARSHMR